VQIAAVVARAMVAALATTAGHWALVSGYRAVPIERGHGACGSVGLLQPGATI